MKSIESVRIHDFEFTYTLYPWLLLTLLFLPIFSVSAGSIKTPPNEALKRGLVGHWTFDGDQMVGGTVRDVSGQGNHGSMINMATSTSRVGGKIGQGLNFDGVDDKVTIGSDFVGTNEATVCAWTYAKKTDNNNIIVSNGKFGLLGNTNNRLSLTSDNISFANSASNAWVTNVWQHWCGTRNTSGTANMYLNGVLNGTANQNSGTVISGTGNINIGGFPSFLFHQGLIDDVRIYNRILSASEISQLYKLGENKFTTPKPQTTLKTGLVGHWTFDGKDMVGGTVRDISGNSNHGSMVNMATSTSRVSGKIGQGLGFDGVDDYMTPGLISSINGVAQLSVSQWIKMDKNDALQVFSGQFSAGTGWTLQNESSFFSSVLFVFSSGTGNKGRSTITLTKGKWHHVVAVYDGTQADNASRLKLYIDGVQDTVNFSGTVPATLVTTATSLRVGGWNGAGSYFRGSTDELRIYNRVLSATEISQLYKLGETKITTPKSQTNLKSGLVGHWTFDGKDMVGGTVRDISGNSNHGSMVNMATSTSRVSGKIGQGLGFDGVNDSVTVGALSSIDAVSAITVSHWVKTNTNKQHVFSGKFSSGAAGWDFQTSGTTRKPLFVFYPSSAYGITTTTTLEENVWYHLVAVFDGSGSDNASRLKFYINGVEQAVSFPAGSIPSSISSTAASVMFGGWSGGSSYCGCQIDETRIYTRALSATEIKQIYNMGK